MTKLDWVSADQLDRQQLILQNEELRSMLEDMHLECDEHEENDMKIIGELRTEIARLTAALEQTTQALGREHVDLQERAAENEASAGAACRT